VKYYRVVQRRMVRGSAGFCVLHSALSVARKMLAEMAGRLRVADQTAARARRAFALRPPRLVMWLAAPRRMICSGVAAGS
jgi:hypothetical protein